jgi:hypothetical protein
MAAAKLGRAVWVRFLLRAVLLVTTALTAAALAAGPAIAQNATWSATPVAQLRRTLAYFWRA